MEWNESGGIDTSLGGRTKFFFSPFSAALFCGWMDGRLTENGQAMKRAISPLVCKSYVVYVCMCYEYNLLSEMSVWLVEAMCWYD